MTLHSKSRIGLVAASLAVLLAAGSAGAAEPTEQLRGYVDRVLAVLSDPDLHTEQKTEERRAAVRKVAGDVFDLEEMSRRALARHWQARTPAERQEFSQLFFALLEHGYLGKIELYRGEKVSYLGEAVDRDLATVRTKIVTEQGVQVPVDYRMHRRADRWLVYDVVVEGVSLVSNYRTQFNQVIQRSSYQELVARMKAKQLAAARSGTASATSRRGAAR